MVASADQNKKIPEHYRWLHTSIGYRIVSGILYALAVCFAEIYTRLILRVKVENRKVLKQAGKSGLILYGNHTQEMGDAFAPAAYLFPRRMYAVASPANLGIPVLGKLLPMLGAIVTPEGMDQMKDFTKAMETRLKEGAGIVIYPEAHVWPWCSFLRPFAKGSFWFPVKYQVPCYSMTTTYQKPKFGKRPKIRVYIDGPFEADPNLKGREAQNKLMNDVQTCMEGRMKNSTYAYVRYERKETV